MEITERRSECDNLFETFISRLLNNINMKADNIGKVIDTGNKNMETKINDIQKQISDIVDEQKKINEAFMNHQEEHVHKFYTFMTKHHKAMTELTNSINNFMSL